MNYQIDIAKKKAKYLLFFLNLSDETAFLLVSSRKVTKALSVSYFEILFTEQFCTMKFDYHKHVRSKCMQLETEKSISSFSCISLTNKIA